jgi:hypothetical protein
MEMKEIGLKVWPIVGVIVVEAFLFGVHWFVYRTWVDFHGNLAPANTPLLREVVIALAFSFVVAALLSFRFVNPLVSLFYKFACLWLGFLNFFVWASCLVWLIWFAIQLAGISADPAPLRPWIVGPLFALAILAAVYGLINALWIRIRRVTVKLPGLPQQWRGRKAVLLSDLHLGNVNGLGFCRRIAAMVAREKPDIVFVPGDLFDGTKADCDRIAAPLKELAPPFGMFYSTGNHEEFTGAAHFLEAVKRIGLRDLGGECVDMDGLQIAGVTYDEANYPLRMKAAIEGMNRDRSRPSILLNHAPSRLPMVAQAGFSLQLSGHTHGGQVFPFTWLTRRVFGKFTQGLHTFGSLQVYTSTGAGTWGPPMRVGSHPEIVVLTFD